MSSTTGKGDPLCRYYTPDALAEAICGIDAVRAILDAAEVDVVRALDPHAGGGAFVRALTRRIPCVTALDIDPAAPALGMDIDCACEDFLAHRGRYDLVVGNPPFADAEAHVRHALSLLSPGGRLVFLLRLAFLAGQARADALWASISPKEVHVLSKRPSFTGGGTDSADYAVFVWEAGWTGETALRWLRWGRG